MWKISCWELIPVEKDKQKKGGVSSTLDLPLFVRIFCDKNEVISTQLSLSDRFKTEIIKADRPLQKRLENWLSDYLTGISLPFFPPYLDAPFTQKALDFLPTIPFGQTLTYAEVAQALGKERAARAVGNACRVNPFPLLVPCHRVVAAQGKLGGFSAGLEIKKLLLSFESRPKQSQDLFRI